MTTKQLTVLEFLAHLDEKLRTGDYQDSVHKIKLLTCREMIIKIMQTEL
jgi:hypothetical protein